MCKVYRAVVANCQRVDSDPGPGLSQAQTQLFSRAFYELRRLQHSAQFLKIIVKFIFAVFTRIRSWAVLFDCRTAVTAKYSNRSLMDFFKQSGKVGWSSVKFSSRPSRQDDPQVSPLGNTMMLSPIWIHAARAQDAPISALNGLKSYANARCLHN